VDKLERETPEAIGARLSDEVGLDRAVIGEVLSIFGHRDFDAMREVYGAVEGIAPETERMRQLLEDLEAMGLGEYVRFDLGVVRGLAYYTGVVFEIFDVQGQLRAIAGGGRYDDLLALVSDVDLPALGFGMGDVVLRELLVDRGLMPGARRTVDFYVIIVTPDQRHAALRIVHQLRDAGHVVEYSLRHQGVGKQLKAAGALGTRIAIILGPDELAAGEMVVRSMESGEERRMPIGGIPHIEDP
jgi:histidyl-tRNA synthetase